MPNKKPETFLVISVIYNSLILFTKNIAAPLLRKDVSLSTKSEQFLSCYVLLTISPGELDGGAFYGYLLKLVRLI